MKTTYFMYDWQQSCIKLCTLSNFSNSFRRVCWAIL